MMWKNHYLGMLLMLVSAQGIAADNIKFNGFASIVSGIDLKDENARPDYNNETFDNLQESRLALQMTAQLEEGMRFIGQAVARGDKAEGYASNYEWAYFDFNVGSSGKLKFGRVRVPFYKYSDYIDVGYAYHWIKPPEAQYSISFRNADGVSYNHHFQLGSLDSALTLLYGRYQGILRAGGIPSQGEIRNLSGARWNLSFSHHEFYLSYWQGDCLIEDTSAIVGLIALAGASGIDASDIRYDGDLCYFYGGGYKGTFGDFGLHAEAGSVDVENAAFATRNGGYVGATYQLDDYLFHVNYESRTFVEERYDSTVLNTLLSASGGKISNIIVGLRRDIGFSSAVKFEVHQYDTSDGFNPNAGVITGHTPDDEYSATLVKLGFDTMF